MLLGKKLLYIHGNVSRWNTRRYSQKARDAGIRKNIGYFLAVNERLSGTLEKWNSASGSKTCQCTYQEKFIKNYWFWLLSTCLKLRSIIDQRRNVTIYANRKINLEKLCCWSAKWCVFYWSDHVWSNDQDAPLHQSKRYQKSCWIYHSL